MHFLGREGWLSNKRGRGGGLELAAPPETVRLGDVVRAAEGVDMLAECFSDAGDHCVIAPVCQLRGVLSEALRAFYEVLDRYTLAELASNRHELARILFVDPPRKRA